MIIVIVIKSNNIIIFIVLVIIINIIVIKQSNNSYNCNYNLGFRVYHYDDNALTHLLAGMCMADASNLARPLSSSASCFSCSRLKIFLMREYDARFFPGAFADHGDLLEYIFSIVPSSGINTEEWLVKKDNVVQYFGKRADFISQIHVTEFSTQSDWPGVIQKLVFDKLGSIQYWQPICPPTRPMS
jgi:hypothetical protein